MEESNDPEQAKRVEGPHPSLAYLYLRSHARHYYVGTSQNPEERLRRHDSELGSKMARDQGDFSLHYVSQPLGSKSDARKERFKSKGERE